MAQYNELPVYKATYDLLLAIFQFTKEFSKEYKYTVGESLKKESNWKNNRQRNGNKNYMSIGVSVRTTKFVARNNGIGVRQVSNPQSPTAYSSVRYAAL